MCACQHVCGLVGVNLHVNEMALSALASNNKIVKAKDAIFGVCVCIWFMFSCVNTACVRVCIYCVDKWCVCGCTRPGNPSEVQCLYLSIKTHFLRCVCVFYFVTSEHMCVWEQKPER